MYRTRGEHRTEPRTTLASLLHGSPLPENSPGPYSTLILFVSYTYGLWNHHGHWAIVPKGSTGLGSFEPLVINFCQSINMCFVHFCFMFYVHFCLKTHYVTYCWFINTTHSNSSVTHAWSQFIYYTGFLHKAHTSQPLHLGRLDSTLAQSLGATLNGKITKRKHNISKMCPWLDCKRDTHLRVETRQQIPCWSHETAQ